MRKVISVILILIFVQTTASVLAEQGKASDVETLTT